MESAPSEVVAEFERQLATLLDTGYPEAAGSSPAEFAAHVEPLRAHLDHVHAGATFAIVVTHDLVARDRAIERVRRQGKAAFSVMDAEDLARFDPVEGVEVPEALAYLALDLDRGDDTRNLRPDDAWPRIAGAGRSPLTLDEGIAYVTHHPAIVARNFGFSLLASRCGDRRVTALWISEARPKLGWCWAGNPHTWLSSASCAGRAAPGYPA